MKRRSCKMARKFCYDEVPVVQTKAGQLKGYQLDGVYIFKGIPYAKAERFQMPVRSMNGKVSGRHARMDSCVRF